MIGSSLIRFWRARWVNVANIRIGFCADYDLLDSLVLRNRCRMKSKPSSFYLRNAHASFDSTNAHDGWKHIYLHRTWKAQSAGVVYQECRHASFTKISINRRKSWNANNTLRDEFSEKESYFSIVIQIEIEKMNFAIDEQWNSTGIFENKTYAAWAQLKQAAYTYISTCRLSNLQCFCIFSVIVGAAVSFDMSRGAYGFFVFNAQTTQTFICLRNLSVLSFRWILFETWNASHHIVSNSHAINFHPRLFHFDNSTAAFSSFAIKGMCSDIKSIHEAIVSFRASGWKAQADRIHCGTSLSFVWKGDEIKFF